MTSTPDLTDSELRLRADTEILGSIHSINDGLRGLANTVEMENQHAFERIGLLERRLVMLERVVKTVIEHLGEQEDDANWLKGNGGTPNAP